MGKSKWTKLLEATVRQHNKEQNRLAEIYDKKNIAWWTKRCAAKAQANKPVTSGNGKK